MGLLARMSSVSSPARLRASSGTPAPWSNFWYTPEGWLLSLDASGIQVTPELAMTLSAMYCGITTIGYDLATLPNQVFKYRDDGGKDRVRSGRGALGTGGIGSLVYLLRWQPNAYQTAAEYMLGQVAQFFLRGRAYAEIIQGPSGFLEQLLPRHPDRVLQERLPSGRLRYRLTEYDGTPRYVTQDEMHVVRDLSLDGGMTSLGTVRYGSRSLGTAIAARDAQAKFFKSGMTAAMLATYAGDKDEEDENSLHKSISRYAAGTENSFGLMLVPDDIKISSLGVEPEKAQMMLAQEWGVREVARNLRMPGSKLGLKDSVSYASQVQSAIDYVIGCLRPIAVTFEQAIQRDLILAKDTYFTEFKLEAMLRGDPAAQAEYFSKLIQARVYRPSEARLILNMNPDPDLDRLSEGDFRPGTSSTGSGQSGQQPPPNAGARAVGGGLTRGALKAMLAVHETAARCVRRERAAVVKLAQKHASDVPQWHASLREFYSDHAHFVAEKLRLDPAIARSYAAQHGSEFELNGARVLLDDAAYAEWEMFEADELASLALCEGDSVDAWFDRRLKPPVAGALDARG
jgi:HK97 family phage portal protein